MAERGQHPQTGNTGHDYGGPYRGDCLNQIAFPMGGLGAGMICLEGTGGLSKFSLHHRPNLTSEPQLFAAISIRQPAIGAFVLEGPVPPWKLQPRFADRWSVPSITTWGLPRFADAAFESRFPFASINLSDPGIPLAVELTGWSPFAPGDADNASLPVAGLEYRFTNCSAEPIEAIFSFNTENFLVHPYRRFVPGPDAEDRIRSIDGGFVLYAPGTEERRADEGCFAVWVDELEVRVNHAWFRGGWADGVRMIWADIASGACAARASLPECSAPGASLFVPLKLGPGESRTVALKMAWHVPQSDTYAPNVTFQDGQLLPIDQEETYRPFYAGRFAGIDEVVAYWRGQYDALRHASSTFARTLYDSTLPPEVLEAVAANLSILKSPTVLRQSDGSLWAWEGSNDTTGSCYGSCSHVWNYAQAVAHLFPELERGLRETEFGSSQTENGYQAHRSSLPIRPAEERRAPLPPPSADGQLGGIIKFYRDWRISGDTDWLLHWWPRIRASLDYCIEAWDPEHSGWLEELHLTTYDVGLWGPDSLCTGFYLAALKAAVAIGEAAGEPVDLYCELFQRGVQRMETELYNGEFFIQKIQWENLRTPFAAEVPPGTLSPEAIALAQVEGPPHQLGPGCLADGVFGAWLALAAGLGEVLDPAKVESHLLAVHRHNLKASLVDHVNLSRPLLGCGPEPGVLLCSWPRGGRPALPTVYADEVWTGIEYQVASHLIALGHVDQGLEIVRAARARYDGRVRNPFSEIEAGHWYGRALSSYGLLQALSGARYDAVDKLLYLKPAINGDFRCFLATATGYGTVGVRDGQPFLDVVSGEIPCTAVVCATR